MTPADLKARILKAAERNTQRRHGAHASLLPALQGDCLAAAREALTHVKEQMDGRYEWNKAEYHAAWAKAEDKDDTDYEEGKMDAAGHAASLVDAALAALTVQEQTDDRTDSRDADSRVVPQGRGSEAVALSPAVEALLKEAEKAQVIIGDWPSVALDMDNPGFTTGSILMLLDGLMSALRASETARQQAEQAAWEARRGEAKWMQHYHDQKDRAEQAEQERDKLKAVLFDPHVLRVNMLRGDIPKLRDIDYADELAATVEKLSASLAQLEAEIARLREQDYRAGYRSGYIDGGVPVERLKEWEDGNVAAYLKAQTGTETK